jgi:hypothetical protein
MMLALFRRILLFGNILRTPLQCGNHVFTVRFSFATLNRQTAGGIILLTSNAIANYPAAQLVAAVSEKKQGLSDFYHLMMLLEGGILNRQGAPSQALIALSNYFKMDSKPSLPALTAAWDKKFFLRHPNTKQPVERWHLQPLALGREWELHRHEILPLLKSTGLLAPRFPRYGNYDTLIIHGARQEDILPRLKFIAQFWQQGGRFKRIAVLTGERPLTSEELEKKNWSDLPFNQAYLKDISSEITLMQYVWRANEILPKEIKELPITWINTPNTLDANGEIRRGITADTIDVWLDAKPLGDNSNWGNCLAVANAPLILRQHVVFERKIYERKLALTVETVGLAEGREAGQWIIYYLREIAGLLWELNQFNDYINSPLLI